MQKIKIGHRAKFRAKHKCFSHILFRFARFYVAFNLRWAYFDSLSLRMHLDEDCTRTCSKKPFRASLNAYRNPSCKNVYFCTRLTSRPTFLCKLFRRIPETWAYLRPIESWCNKPKNSNILTSVTWQGMIFQWVWYKMRLFLKTACKKHWKQ